MDVGYYTITYPSGIVNKFICCDPDEMMDTICHIIIGNHSNNKYVSKIVYNGVEIHRRGNKEFKFVFVDDNNNIVWKKNYTPDDFSDFEQKITYYIGG